ncbi:6-phosphogluconolactonase [Pseudothermotoga sp.]|nr:6-phosphogluconolactonase [Pseudothermotoga sp.]MDW8139709.1 6-phosphogluconolactonase [Pseudothermotoga sp.]
MAKAVIHVSQQDFYDFSLMLIASKIEEVLSRKPNLKIVLAGGRTPLPLYERLIQIDLPWDEFEFFLSDERFVPLDSNDSNFKAINEVFFSKLNPSPRGVHFFRTDLEPAEALNSYTELLRKHAPEGFDLAILGMGEDGHVASIFELDDSVWREDVVFVAPSGTPKVPRISLTLKTLNRTDHVIFLIAGQEKKKKLHEMFSGKILPAAFVEGRRETVWLVSG